MERPRPDWRLLWLPFLPTGAQELHLRTVAQVIGPFSKSGNVSTKGPLTSVSASMASRSRAAKPGARTSLTGDDVVDKALQDAVEVLAKTGFGSKVVHEVSLHHRFGVRTHRHIPKDQALSKHLGTTPYRYGYDLA